MNTFRVAIIEHEAIDIGRSAPSCICAFANKLQYLWRRRPISQTAAAAEATTESA